MKERRQRQRKRVNTPRLGGRTIRLALFLVTNRRESGHIDQMTVNSSKISKKTDKRFVLLNTSSLLLIEFSENWSD